MNSSSSMPRSCPSSSSRRYLAVRNRAESTPLEWLASAPTSTFSRAVIELKSRMFWKVRAMPRLVMACFFRPARGWPSKRTSPEVGW